MDDDEPSECLIISQYISASSLPLLQENKENLDDHGEGEDDEDDKKPLMVTKKWMKLGMVKTRSITTLLGQTLCSVPWAKK
jgi:hypothetical protein